MHLTEPIAVGHLLVHVGQQARLAVGRLERDVYCCVTTVLAERPLPQRLARVILQPLSVDSPQAGALGGIAT